tara:strand:- start:2427 stop:3740 length:1314 start_codon:yes stop_codon:yes gene_type:complete
MPINILMPALSPTMTEGNVANWLKKEGDPISPGDLLCEIETDKATMEVESVDEGVLAKIVVPDGTEGVEVNTVIGIILESGEDKSNLSVDDNNITKQETKNSNGEESQKISSDILKKELNKQSQVNISSKTSERIFASPLARRMAEQAGIDISKIIGTGPGGRIVKVDIETAIPGNNNDVNIDSSLGENDSTATKNTTSIPSIGGEGSHFEDIKISNMRKTIASRLQESKQQIPHFYLSVDCEVDALLHLRKDLNKRTESGKITINDFVIKASALALRKLPDCNTSWIGDGKIRRYSQVDISVAVSINDGLVTPVIKNADSLGLIEISNTINDLSDRARATPMGLLPEEYQGGSFSISNLGMYNINEFLAVINPPQGMILSVGTAEQRPVVRDGALAVANVMTCNLSVDHRVIDGAKAAEFINLYKSLIEDPISMLL